MLVMIGMKRRLSIRMQKQNVMCAPPHLLKVVKRYGDYFDAVSPPFENGVGGGTRPFHPFKGEVQICKR